MITDRDITVGCVAAGGDPTATIVKEFAGDKPVTIGADDSAAGVGWVEGIHCADARRGLGCRLPAVSRTLA